METLSFKDLLNSILSLFESTADGYSYKGIVLLNKTPGGMEIYERAINLCIGGITDFHDYLKPKLVEFFTDFDKTFFFTQSERKNHRRFYRYESIVKSKLCRRDSFKRKMMKELFPDIALINKYESFDTQENRRILFLNCIKNYVHRLFLIDVYYYP